MIALDTNILVRVVTADDPRQLKAAVAGMESGPLWVSKTVLLETEWVLRFTYELSRAAILGALQSLLGYQALEVESRGTVLRAFRWYEKGMDFADALHLASSADADRFATFDRELAKLARSLGDEVPAVELL